MLATLLTKTSAVIFTKAFTMAVAAIGVVGMISQEWATPVNTLLLIVLMFGQGRFHKKIDAVHSDVSAASAAALAAAEASAHAAVASSDAARISREIGSSVRRSSPRPPTQ